MSDRAADDPHEGDGPHAGPTGPVGGKGLAGNSVDVAFWTLVSRLTGFVRVAVIAAVLGPTYFGNLFQATNLLPNVTYEFLTGSLFASLLVPALVAHVDRDDPVATRRLAGGFLGVTTLGFAAIALVVMVFGQAVISLLTLGVTDAAAAAAQQRVGWPLLLLLMPQVVLYGLAGTGVAVQNAHGRFALAAAAPAVENIGVVITLIVSALVFGTGTDVAEVTTAHLVLIGLGTTASVAAHAALQWWGARRVGVTLVPTAGWRDPEIRQIVRLMVPSLGYAALSAARFLGILIVAGSVPGGVVAFQMALNFFNLPVALGARPVAAALLPTLARLRAGPTLPQFHETWIRGLTLSMFVTIPAGVAYVVLADPLARAVSFGEMADPRGIMLLVPALAALGLGVIGDANFVVHTHASYARLDARGPLRAMVLRTVVTFLGLGVAFTVPSPVTVMLVLGLTVAVSDIIGSLYLGRTIRIGLPRSGVRLGPPLARTAIASVCMVVPARLLTDLTDGLPGPAGGATLSAALAAVLGMAIYLVVQSLTGSTELRDLRRGLAHRDEGS